MNNLNLSKAFGSLFAGRDRPVSELNELAGLISGGPCVDARALARANELLAAIDAQTAGRSTVATNAARAAFVEWYGLNAHATDCVTGRAILTRALTRLRQPPGWRSNS